MAKVKLLDPSDKKRKLDRYELIGELASGGMATVYLARLAGAGGFQRFVAIKRLHPHLAAEEEFIEMFLDEARLAAGIHHPHVVPILEVGQTSNGYYLVMEYIEGDTLARVVARSLSQGKEVPRPILFRILLDTLAGLHAAHELADDRGSLVQLVHRDCSPQNILVGVDGCSRITDFGVARASSRLSNTRADRLKGKLAYMSPEQAQGDVELDRRSDLFAMGVILWEVLASRRLFKADTEAGTMRRVLLEPIARLSSVVPSVHRAIDEVCSRALERNIARRFQSAAEMADALERAARETAKEGNSGVASPREVAAYMQGALGQDIAAQRECVRAWLAQSETSMPIATTAMRGVVRDVTFKVPLDREPGSALRPLPAPAQPRSGPLPAPLPPPRRGAATGPSSAEPGREVRALSPTLPAGHPAAISLKEARAAAAALKASADPEDENETLLMVRDGPLQAVPEPPSEREPSTKSPAQGVTTVEFQDPTLAATSLVKRHSVYSRRRAGGVVVLIAVILLAGGVLAWFKLRPHPGSSEPAPETHEKPAITAAPAATPTTPTAPAPSSSVPTEPASQPTASAASAVPLTLPPRGLGARWRPAGKPPPSKTAAPGTPPPPGGEDVANPYR